jgi:hypothetical protein
MAKGFLNVTDVRVWSEASASASPVAFYKSIDQVDRAKSGQ